MKSQYKLTSENFKRNGLEPLFNGRQQLAVGGGGCCGLSVLLKR